MLRTSLRVFVGPSRSCLGLFFEWVVIGLDCGDSDVFQFCGILVDSFLGNFFGAVFLLGAMVSPFPLFFLSLLCICWGLRGSEPGSYLWILFF